MHADAGGRDDGVATVDETRPLRADAQRNRARVLEVAAQLFAAEGVDVPIDRIAAEAGVGVGTVYRHFPTKERLFEAIVVERLEEMIERAQRCLATEPPERAFFTYVDFMTAQFLRSSDLLDAFADAGIEFAVVGASTKKKLEAAVEDLLVAAQRAGSVRSDVTAPTVMVLIGASCMASKQPHPGVPSGDMIRIVLDGLRPPT